jgi:hypothetical protein
MRLVDVWFACIGKLLRMALSKAPRPWEEQCRVSWVVHTFGTSHLRVMFHVIRVKRPPSLQLKMGQSAGNSCGLLEGGVGDCGTPACMSDGASFLAAIQLSCEHNCFFGCIASPGGKKGICNVMLQVCVFLLAEAQFHSDVWPIDGILENKSEQENGIR